MEDDDILALCTKVAKLFKGMGDDGEGGDDASAEPAEDLVVKCEGIILAYAGKSLLRSTKLRLVRGKRYGIVGQNGVGKTTLLTRINEGNIAGFPQDICVVYVQHEILANDETTVLQYMKNAQDSLKGEGVHGARTEADIVGVLETMGFDEIKRGNGVLELSGGWRMKLALAGAILREADLLLLDEPTNHLDAASVLW